MKIQLITNNSEYNSFSEFEISSLNEPRTFDLFDINIVDLAFKGLWENKSQNFRSINCIHDLISIKDIISASTKSVVVFVLPQNIYFYNGVSQFGTQVNYNGKEQIKNILDQVIEILGNIIDEFSFLYLFYENSITNINGEQFKSAFVFEHTYDSKNSLAVAEGSQKSTVLREGVHIATTLDIFNSENSVIAFLKGIGLINEEKESIPEWLKNYDILDDKEQKAIISEKKAQIEEAKQAIQSAEDKLNENLEFKSILFENSNSLVKHVFSILEEILSCNLSNFVDVKKEDFLINLPNITFIGEIKGISSNVKSSNVSQIDVRYQEYLEKLKEDEKEENVKQLLIINHQRQKPLNERESVNEEQISIAARNGNLIIETPILLEIFIKFRIGEITTEKIIEVFSTETGLLKMEAFE